MYYIVSLRHTVKYKKFVTLWGPNDANYHFSREMSGLYEQYKEGYHNNEGNKPITKELADSLFERVVYEGQDKHMIAISAKNMKAIGIKFNKRGDCVLVKRGQSTRHERLLIVNKIIQSIAERGRKFFQNKGQVASLTIDNKGKIWYKREWFPEGGKEYICLSVPYESWKEHMHHGGTLKSLMIDFIDFIRTGKKGSYSDCYGNLYCPHWGYPESEMEEIRKIAIELGYLIDINEAK